MKSSFLFILCLALGACAALPPPPPVAVQAISLAPIEGEIRKAVRSNDTAGAEIERARVALARARKLLAVQAK